MQVCHRERWTIALLKRAAGLDDPRLPSSALAARLALTPYGQLFRQMDDLNTKLEELRQAHNALRC